MLDCHLLNLTWCAAPLAPPPAEAFLGVSVKTNIAAHTWQNTFWRRPDLFTSVSILVPVPSQATTRQQWSTIVSPLSHVFTDVYITPPVLSKPDAKDVFFLPPPGHLPFGKLFLFHFVVCWAESEQRLQAATQKAAVSFRVTRSLYTHKEEETCKRRTSWPIPGRHGKAHLFLYFSLNQCLKMDKILLFFFPTLLDPSQLEGSNNVHCCRMMWRQTRLQRPPGYSWTVFSYKWSLMIFIFTCQYQTLKMSRYKFKRSNLYQVLKKKKSFLTVFSY